MRNWIVLAGGGGLSALLAFAVPARAQQAVLMSQANGNAQNAQSTAASTPDYYNLKLGPTQWHFGAGLTLQYNDNVSLVQTEPGWDFITIPQLTAGMVWPLSEQNALNLSVALGYSAYARNPQLDQFYVTPNSQLSLAVGIGEFKLDFHERLAISQFAYQDPTVTGTGNYSQLQNDVGVTGTRDWENAGLQAAYDHANYDTLTGAQGNGNGQSDSLSGSVLYKFRPGLSLGPEAGASLFQHEGSQTNQGNEYQCNVGASLKAQISEYLTFEGSLGYMISWFDQGGSGGQSPSSKTIYAQATLTHHLNQYLDYTISGGRSENASYFGGSFITDQANLDLNLHVIHDVSLSATFGFQEGSQAFGGGGSFDQYNAGINLARPIASWLTGSLGYQAYWHRSDGPGQNYTANIISLNFSCLF